jgi:hypothetical protein
VPVRILPLATTPAIKDSQHSRKESGGDYGMAFARPVNKVEGIIPRWNRLIVDQDLDGTSAQPARHFRNVSRALFQGAEEPQIVAARL